MTNKDKQADEIIEKLESFCLKKGNQFTPTEKVFIETAIEQTTQKLLSDEIKFLKSIGGMLSHIEVDKAIEKRLKELGK